MTDISSSSDPPVHVQQAAHSLALTGCLLLFTGLIYGVFVHAAPYPRIALAAHIQMTAQGVMSIASGVLLATPSLCRSDALSKMQCRIVTWAHWLLVLQCGSEVVAAYTGAAETLKIATEQQGSNAGKASDTIEAVIGLLHFGPGVGLIIAYGMLSWAIWRSSRNPVPMAKQE